MLTQLLLLLLPAHTVTKAEDLKWNQVVPGVMLSVVSGDPQADGQPFVIRIKLADRARIAPHWHPVDEHLTVLSGAFFMGMGETMDDAAAKEMTPGSYGFMPKEMRHFAFVKGETVVQIHGAGPFKTYFVESAKVPYPADYRNWAVVKSVIIGAQSKMFAAQGGFHHFYANPPAMEGYRSGAFPDGSIIVDERVHAKDYEGIAVEGELRSVAVMLKDSRVHRATGGWGFERFEGDNQSDGATAQVRANCYSCHSAKKDRDHVFSSLRK